MASTKLKVTQINLQHCKAATHLLCSRIQKLHTDICLIQEPYLYGNTIRLITNVNGNVYVRPITRPRTCIYVPKDIEANLITEYSSDDCTVVKVKVTQDLSKVEILMVSAYLPYDPQDMPPTEAVRKVVDYASRTNIPIILGVDANSHNEIWGSSNTNPRGRALLEYVAQTNLDILNKGCEPTFMNIHRREVIDITLASVNVTENIRGWKVLKDETASEHRYITLEKVVDLV